MVDISCKTPGGDPGVLKCVVCYINFEGVNKIHVVYYNNKTFITKNTGYLLKITELPNDNRIKQHNHKYVILYLWVISLK